MAEINEGVERSVTDRFLGRFLRGNARGQDAFVLQVAALAAGVLREGLGVEAPVADDRVGLGAAAADELRQAE